VVPAQDHLDPEPEDVEMEPIPGPSAALTMDDQPMPDIEDVDDMPILEEAEDEEFHSLMEDALMDTLPSEDSSSSDTSVEEEKDSTPTKPPVEFSRFAMEKAGPSTESPICSKPKPFVLRPPTLPGPAQPPKLTPAQSAAAFQAAAAETLLEELKWKNMLNPFRKSTRSNTKIEGDPTRVYLPTRTSKKK